MSTWKEAPLSALTLEAPPTRRRRKTWHGRQVIALMGAPGAGKSTWAGAFPNVVATDALRGLGTVEKAQVDAVYGAAFDRVVALLKENMHVVFDGTLAHPGTRRRLLAVANGYHAPTRLIVFRTPLETCIARQLERAHPVPADKVREIHAAIEAALPGLEAEGWGSIEMVWDRAYVEGAPLPPVPEIVAPVPVRTEPEPTVIQSAHAPLRTRTSGPTHWARRRAQWAQMLPQPCVRCGELVTADQEWHLDHTTPKSLGGNDADARPSHSHCNVIHGSQLGHQRARELIAKGKLFEQGIVQTEKNVVRLSHSSVSEVSNLREIADARIFSSENDPACSRAQLADTRPTAGIGNPTPSTTQKTALNGPAIADFGNVTPGPRDPAWDAAPWLDDYRDVPENATWPRLMTLPHPSATGSYGPEAIAWSEERLGRPLRWWQRLALVRTLEYGPLGLVFPYALWSLSRQLGKSWALRELALWRIHQSERFGEPQLVLHTAKDLPVAKEVQRSARAWAHRLKDDGYIVREQNGQEEIQTPDGGRWMIRGRGSIYGYSASLAVVDEAWGVLPEVVEDGLEPTMAERTSSQIALISTAHRFATGLMQSRRATAIEQLEEPRDTLILEWSAPAGSDISDRNAWRMASPHWTDRRERLVEAQHGRALVGAPSVDPDEPDPLASFRSQWLNIWPPRIVAQDGRGMPLLEEGHWAGLVDLGQVPAGPQLVFGLEDWFGMGAATAVAGRLADGRLFVWGRLHARRAEAAAWITDLAAAHPNSTLVLGSSLEGDPDVAAIPIDLREKAGQAETRTSLPLLRELVATKRVAHDGGVELTQQVEATRVVESRTGGLQITPGPGRTDLLRAAAWALSVAVRLPVPDEEPAVF